jgi:hypothetical protein
MAYGRVMVALADPTRRALFERLRTRPHTVGELARKEPDATTAPHRKGSRSCDDTSRECGTTCWLLTPPAIHIRQQSRRQRPRKNEEPGDVHEERAIGRPNT